MPQLLAASARLCPSKTKRQRQKPPCNSGHGNPRRVLTQGVRIVFEPCDLHRHRRSTLIQERPKPIMPLRAGRNHGRVNSRVGWYKTRLVGASSRYPCFG